MIFKDRKRKLSHAMEVLLLVALAYLKVDR